MKKISAIITALALTTAFAYSQVSSTPQSNGQPTALVLSIDMDAGFPRYIAVGKDTLVLMTVAQMDTANIKLMEWKFYRKYVAQQDAIIKAMEESRESSDYTIQYLDSSLAASEAANKLLVKSNQNLTVALSKGEKLLADTVKSFRRKIWRIAVPVFVGGVATGAVAIIAIQ